MCNTYSGIQVVGICNSFVCTYAYTKLKKGLSLSKLESLKGEGKEDGLPLMMPCRTLSPSGCAQEPCSDVIHLGIISFKKNGAVIYEAK